MSHWPAIIPFVIIVIVAVKTKQVIPGLGLALIVASYILQPTLVGGMNRTARYIIDNLAIHSNLYSIGFIYIFAGMINLIVVTGGIKGFIAATSQKIKNRKQTLWLIWITTLGTFSAPTLRIVAVAPIIKALQKRVGATKERLSFLVEATATPIVAITPVATAFIGYMISTVHLALKTNNMTGNPYQLYLKSIPFNIFTLLVLILALVFTIVGHPKFMEEKKIDNKQERREHDKKEYENSDAAASSDLPARAYNLYVPIITTIVFSVVLSWYSGFVQTHNFGSAFFNANVGLSMFVAILVSFIITVVMLMIEKYPLKTIVDQFFIGSNVLMSALVIFALVWGLSAATDDLGLPEFIVGSLSWMPKFLLAPMFFLIGSLLGYFIGSSWGIWGILMPIGFSIARMTGSSLPLFIGITFACGTLADFLSPLSGNTITMAKIMGMDLINYSKYKLKHAALPFALSLLGYFVLYFII